METTDQGSPDEHRVRITETDRLAAEMERLELRARMLLTEHRNVVETIREMQRKLDAAGGY